MTEKMKMQSRFSVMKIILTLLMICFTGSQSTPVSSQPTRPPLPTANQLINNLPTMAQNIPLPQPPIPVPPQSQAPPKPPQLTLSQQQQLEQQLQQLQLQQQHQQQTVLNQPFVLNENQRQTLQNLILRQQQEAQQLAQQTSLQFPQLQLTPQQQDHLFQVSLCLPHIHSRLF